MLMSFDEIRDADESNGCPVNERDRVFKPEEVAIWLRVATDDLRRWRETGEGPAFIHIAPRVYRYRWGDLSDWLHQNRHRALPASPRPKRARSALQSVA